MYRSLITLLVVLFSGYASAHEWTPTYPTMKPSHVQGVYYTDMNLFNGRQDVKYYEISVWDKDWGRIPFAAEIRVVPLEYLARKQIRIYLREEDLPAATYICSLSKLEAEGDLKSAISSKICSKIR